jgi:hypothetical protein
MSRTLLGTLAAAFLLLSSPASGAEDANVTKAIERGVAALKKLDDAIPAGPRGGGVQGTGVPALVGLTLLECGVAADDATVKKLAVDLRKECATLTHTYTLALAIMFFDRLGDPRDVPLIQTMGLRLLTGQNESGGWSYDCGETPTKEETSLLDKLTSGIPGPTGAPPPPSEDSLFKRPPPLPAELQEAVERIEKQRKEAAKKKEPHGAERAFFGVGDNSNTQFAILGLWVAGRHGVPIAKAAERIEKRFRSSQNADGGWSYVPLFSRGGPDYSSASMTCAGLLALAVSHGTVNQAVLRTDPKTPPNKLPRDVSRDPAIRAGFLALGTTIGRPVDPKTLGRGPMAGLHKGFYFLWSVERVAVAYSLPTIGNKDWYTWGAQLLVASQAADGTWGGERGADIDTCFALLFLRRVNLARDLSASLTGMKDPGEVKLTAGGVGGEALVQKGLVSGLVLKDGKENANDATRLSRELLRAPADQQEALIGKLKDGKGAEYTEALALAIPQLPGELRLKARDALAERLARMKATTLRDKMQDEDAEVRRAAAVASYMREERSLVPDLIALVEDKDPVVARAAQAALKELTKQDFGPAPGATTTERAKAVAAWKAWWQKQSAK